MRVLMLHGHATSGFIFKAQTVPFRTKLDKSWTFDFPDGPYSCPPPKGLQSVVASAYKWMNGTDVNSIRDSVQWLTRYIEKNGPYDSICCFSKAAVIVSAMLLYNAREGNPNKAIIPKSVIFMNGSIEYSVLEDLGLDVTDEAADIHYKTEEIVKSKGDGMSNLAQTLVKPGAGGGLWDDTSKLVHNPRKMPPTTDCFGLDFTELAKDVVIDIPTVHVVGAKDPIWPSGVQMAYLCNPDKRTFYDHKGGHDLPRTPEVGADIAKIFKNLAAAAA